MPYDSMQLHTVVVSHHNMLLMFYNLAEANADFVKILEFCYDVPPFFLILTVLINIYEAVNVTYSLSMTFK